MQYSDPQRTGEIVTPNPISWWRKNYVRTYCVAIALAVVPLTAFLFGAHNLVGRELIKGLVTQSSRSGKIMAALIERRLLEGTTFLKAFAERPDVVQSWRNGKVSELEVALARAQNLNPDFSTIGVYNEAGILIGSSP